MHAYEILYTESTEMNEKLEVAVHTATLEMAKYFVRYLEKEIINMRK